MKKLLRIPFRVLLVLIVPLMMVSCKDDEDHIESVIIGRAWTGDIGMNASNGEAIVSEFYFGSDGFGSETQFYARDKVFYAKYNFQWYWERGSHQNLVLDYGRNGISYLNNVNVYRQTLTGTFYLSNSSPGLDIQLFMQ